MNKKNGLTTLVVQNAMQIRVFFVRIVYNIASEFVQQIRCNFPCNLYAKCDANCEQNEGVFNWGFVYE